MSENEVIQDLMVHVLFEKVMSWNLPVSPGVSPSNIRLAESLQHDVGTSNSS